MAKHDWEGHAHVSCHDVQITMARTVGGHSHPHFASQRSWIRQIDEIQRLPGLLELHRLHLGNPLGSPFETPL